MPWSYFSLKTICLQISCKSNAKHFPFSVPCLLPLLTLEPLLSESHNMQHFFPCFLFHWPGLLGALPQEHSLLDLSLQFTWTSALESWSALERELQVAWIQEQLLAFPHGEGSLAEKRHLLGVHPLTKRPPVAKLNSPLSTERSGGLLQTLTIKKFGAE